MVISITLAVLDIVMNTFCVLANTYTKQDVKLASQPRGMDVLKQDNIVVTASVNEITVIQDNRKVSIVNYEDCWDWYTGPQERGACKIWSNFVLHKKYTKKVSFVLSR